MQIMKAYEGTLEFSTASAARPVSFGVSGTQTGVTDKNDFFNRTVAEFLHEECGVDAAYEVREGSTYPFLWINNVPFLFMMTGTTTYFRIYGPKSETALLNGSTTNGVAYGVIFNGTTGSYSFTLYFTGDPDTAFALRLKGRNGTTISSSLTMRFLRAKNIVNSRDALVWVYGNTVTAPFVNNVNGIDLADGKIVEESFSTSLISLYPSLNTKAVHRTENPGKLPLVPVMAGIWQPKGVYRRPVGYGLPNPLEATVEQQTELEVSGRRFIITSLDAPAAGYINLGMIEVTR